MAGISCGCGTVYADTRLSCPACRRPRPLTSAAPTAPTSDATEPADEPAWANLLPTELRAAWRIVGQLPVDGSQADLLLVAPAEDDERPTHVLKRYRRDASGDAYERGQTLARLRGVDHPGVVRVDDHDPDGRWEFVEYVPGGTLAALIDERRSSGEGFDELTTRTVIHQLAEALDALHSVGVFHRDLKPSNILVRSRDPLQLALTDFGGAVGTDLSVVLEQVGVATPRYAPPEWFYATSRATGDVWSLGIIGLELLGGHPFDGLEPVQVQARLARRPWPVEPTSLRDAVADDGAEDWELLLRGALHPEPEERWSAREVLAWLDGQDVRRPTDPSAAGAASAKLSDGSYALTVAGVSVVGPRDFAVAVTADPAAWDEGREHLRTGRLRTWAREQLPELLPLLDVTADPDDVLLKVLLTIDPTLPPSFGGYELTEAYLPRLVAGALRGEAEARAIALRLIAPDGPVATIAQYGRAGAHAALENLMARRDDLEGELREAWRELGAFGPQGSGGESALDDDLRLTLLSRILSPGPPMLRRATSAAILRRPRGTRGVLRRSSPTVRGILLDQIAPLPFDVLLGGVRATHSEDGELGGAGVAKVVASALGRDVSIALLAPLLVARRWWRGTTTGLDRTARVANGAVLPSLAMWSVLVGLAVGDARSLIVLEVTLAAFATAVVVALAWAVTTGFGAAAGAIAAGAMMLVLLTGLAPFTNASVFEPTPGVTTLASAGAEVNVVALLLLAGALLPSRLLGPRARELFVVIHRAFLAASAAVIGLTLAGARSSAIPAALTAEQIVLSELLGIGPSDLPVPAVSLLLLFAAALLLGVVHAFVSDRLPRRSINEVRPVRWLARGLTGLFAFGPLFVVVDPVMLALVGPEVAERVSRSIQAGPAVMLLMGAIVWLGLRTRAGWLLASLFERRSARSQAAVGWDRGVAAVTALVQSLPIIILAAASVWLPLAR